MLFGSKYIIRTISAALLGILLLIHSIKLVHTHSTSSLASHDLHKKNLAEKAIPDCSICDYQVNKDADDYVTIFIGDQEQTQNESDSKIIFSYIYSFHAAFENRGPPFSTFA